MNVGKVDLQKKRLAFYMFNLLIGFALFYHAISSWVVSRISYTNYLSELNWLLIFFIVIGSLLTNYLMLKNDKAKGKYILKGLIAFIVGAFIVSIIFIIRVSL
jgi:hypothetical protein